MLLPVRPLTVRERVQGTDKELKEGLRAHVREAMAEELARAMLRNGAVRFEENKVPHLSAYPGTSEFTATVYVADPSTAKSKEDRLTGPPIPPAPPPPTQYDHPKSYGLRGPAGPIGPHGAPAEMLLAPHRNPGLADVIVGAVDRSGGLEIALKIAEDIKSKLVEGATGEFVVDILIRRIKDQLQN